ncbi:hypothetical protein JCM3770_000231 [Rhodotorula araucariae]
MADYAGSPPPQGRKKRPRSGVDPSLIIAEPRQRAGRPQLGGPATRHGGRAGSPNPATVPATDAEGFERVRQLGTQLYERMLAQVDPNDPARPLYYAFSELPSRQDYPDYYKMIKKPISFTEVKAKLDSLQYACLADLRTDLNQIYVNAKRYNAPGSQIFLDAKKQHKLLKDTYAVMTGEAPPPEENDEHDEAPPPSRQRVREAGGGPSGGTGAGGKAAVLKPWLGQKLDELTELVDANGRNYAENFQVLPDRNLWPDYYQLIVEPMAFETVRGRVQKNHYKTVEPFYQDVMTIFENAMFYNEDSSRIWKDAMVLKKHFGDLMQEEPPEYVPPRKSGGSKRRSEPDFNVSTAPSAPRSRRQSSAFPAEDGDAASETGGYEDEDASEDEASRHGSVAPAAQPFAGVQPKVEDIPIGDPYALPGGSPALAANLALGNTGGVPSFSGNPLLDLASASATLNPPFPSGVAYGSLGSTSLAAALNGSSSPVLPMGGRALSGGEVPTFHPRLVARLPTTASPSLVSRFEVRCTPSGVVFTLDNASVRQHALALPPGTERVELAPFFAASDPDADPNDKGKARASANNGGDLSVGDLAPRVVARVRPSPFVALEEVAELPPAGGDWAIASPAAGPRCALKPRKGLSTVEYVIRPAGAPQGEEGDDEALAEGAEVYRVFMTA